MLLKLSYQASENSIQIEKQIAIKSKKQHSKSIDKKCCSN